MLPVERTFAQRFAEAWRRPTLVGLLSLLHPEIVFYQPHLPPIRGMAEAQEEFERLFRWLPKLYGEVDRFYGADSVVFIEWRIIFPIGRKGVSIRSVDRVLLHDGLAIERVVYFNPVPLIIAILNDPRVWAGYLRYRLG